MLMTKFVRCKISLDWMSLVELGNLENYFQMTVIGLKSVWRLKNSSNFFCFARKKF